MTELQELDSIKRKSSELQQIQSEMKGLETRLKYSKTDRENTVKMNCRLCVYIQSMLCSKALHWDVLRGKWRELMKKD